MKFTVIMFASFLLISAQLFAQGGESQVTTVTKATILNPGVSYERGVAPKATVYGQLFLSPSGYFSYSDNFGSNYALYLDLALTMQYRYYYNGLKRQQKGKSTDRNSMNYLAGIVVHAYPLQPGLRFGDEPYWKFYNKLGVAWGLQRNYDNRFSFDWNLGLACVLARLSSRDYYGVRSVRTDTGLRLLSQLNVGFWLNRRN